MAVSDQPRPHIKSKQRVAAHGEVFTPPHIVEAMLDLVEQETANLASRFLEPACGDGNFLEPVLRRKLAVVDRFYKKSQYEWERNAVLAVTSLYGIDILEDNVQACRERLLGVVAERHDTHFEEPNLRFLESVRYILARNIVWGDALTLLTVGSEPAPIVFAEWSPVNGSRFKRRDFVFDDLLHPEQASLGPRQPGLFGEEQESLFHKPNRPLVSDRGENVFLPHRLREYPPVHFLELSHAHG